MEIFVKAVFVFIGYLIYLDFYDKVRKIISHGHLERTRQLVVECIRRRIGEMRIWRKSDLFRRGG